ncbi:hypothetical protein GCM10007269_32040 [Microbacterium murale]|uniref:site-specific DNA-methyltransferase (adenine-specific) n=2 Tax=Microbacterium murale TaxID=1081040 RepID=A0ABQ1RXW9_9MICO|nr:hypothetical protein GCM10007269_32040 [Microbacterium murale]
MGADTNGELVNFFGQSATHGQDIVAILRSLHDDRDTYLQVRDWSPPTDVERAARFAFLNRTGYFGLYRTNQKGRYNVPYGGGGRLNLDTFAKGMGELEEVMRRVSVEHVDYLDLMARVTGGDVVFLDPPYGASGDYPFRRYGSLLFSPSDHRRLAAEAERCRRLGAKIYITLPTDPSLLRLYQGWTVVGERRRGNQLVEVCLTHEPTGCRDMVSSGQWRVPAQVKIVDESEDAPLTGTDF